VINRPSRFIRNICFAISWCRTHQAGLDRAAVLVRERPRAAWQKIHKFNPWHWALGCCRHEFLLCGYSKIHIKLLYGYCRDMVQFYNKNAIKKFQSSNMVQFYKKKSRKKSGERSPYTFSLLQGKEDRIVCYGFINSALLASLCS